MAIRTDLAVELAAQNTRLPEGGVRVRERTEQGVTVTTVDILTPDAARQMGKPRGRYITIDTPPLGDTGLHSDEQTQLVADCIAPLLPRQGPLLVVGLGNEQITPDALGPRCARLVLATRHLTGQPLFAGLRPVAAVAPGVLGQTGIESSDLVRGIVRQVAPAAVVVVDALAARSLSRLGQTLQIADSGIAPGAGVGNDRAELSRHTLGVPVISIGIPTVVDCATLAEDLGGAPPDDPARAAMVVTPRDVDRLVQSGARLIALALNRAAQPGLSLEEIGYLIS